MAIDYGDYANRQGQSVDLSPLQQGIQRFLDKSDQIATISAQNFADNQWSNMMSPYQNALTDDVTAWNPTSTHVNKSYINMLTYQILYRILNVFSNLVVLNIQYHHGFNSGLL